MDYLEATICRVMLLAGVGRAEAARRVDLYIAGQIGQDLLYAPARLWPQPPEPPPRPPRAAKKLYTRPRKRRPRHDLPAPRPLRSRGTPTINMEALGRCEMLSAPRWPDMMYRHDPQIYALALFERFVMYG